MQDSVCETDQALLKAVSAVGSQQKIGEQLGISQAAVSAWLKRGRIPADRVLAVEKISGVSRHELRPDIYPRGG